MMCNEHALPEFDDVDLSATPDAFTLCPTHAPYQIKIEGPRTSLTTLSYRFHRDLVETIADFEREWKNLGEVPQDPTHKVYTARDFLDKRKGG
jgi:hypothetical protein